MKKSLKKFALISMSTLTLAGVAPVSSIFAQDASSEETSEVAESEEVSEGEMSEESEKEASALQKALEEAVASFQEKYPDVQLTGAKIKPLEEKEEMEEAETDSAESEASEDTSAEEESEAESASEGSEESSAEESADAEMMEEEKAFEISLEGEDASGEVKAAYDSSTGEELPEEETDLMGEAESMVDEASEAGDAAVEEAGSMADSVLEGEDSEAESETAEGESSEEAPNYIDFASLKPLDEITKAAEEKAGFGKALEYELTFDENDPALVVWIVKVVENEETPEEGKQAEVTIDAVSGEVIKAEGDLAEEGSAPAGEAADEEKPAEDATEGESAEEESSEEGSEGEESESESGEESESEAESVEETTVSE
ncbi:PepSY domain-containing protein [Ignavigranum ruoffiae]|uniref:PepSY domain-containing protein n=1 Tax=Ignavigranum ruoffiae TaxID=89093 RepID=UPI0020604730|nr:PepSY domain-containing protein [Ignavigranum ruoffiae]UPQ85977.1 PepSY domain-containing protein [Ignavigranum ruoffiae]